MSLAIRLASILLLLLPAAHAATLRLFERNGDETTVRVVAHVAVPTSGVVVIVPDRIFAAGSEITAEPPVRGATGPPTNAEPSTQHTNPASATPRVKGIRKGQ